MDRTKPGDPAQFATYSSHGSVIALARAPLPDDRGSCVPGFLYSMLPETATDSVTLI
jgi:hypothetical protein